MSRVFLIDTDTASDDAVALIMALRAPGISVAGITTVAGNVDVQQATRNALYTAELCESEVPVFVGASRPLLRHYENAHWFHGRDGLGDSNYPPARRSAERGDAASAILQIIHDHPGLTLVTLGPLTNIALALCRDPNVAGKVGRCVIMGGAPCCEGNVTPAAEYNMWVDPEAARIVLRSGLPIDLAGWHLCRHEAVINESEIADILRIDTPLSRFTVECNTRAKQAYFEQTGEHGISLPDPVCMAIALDPTIGTSWSRHYVDVETTSELTRGMTVVDRLNVATDSRNQRVWAELITTERNANVCWTIDVARWKRLLLESLGSVPRAF